MRTRLPSFATLPTKRFPVCGSLLDACGLDMLRGKSSDNLALDAIGEISGRFLLAQILERQHSDRLIRRRHRRH